ncbi:MAG: hypothetical protein HOE90_22605 [Bacteriovoracaceae bacterium]|nr:hypothetical protein [Bacteriovoracaceae bacterium]
MDISSRGKKNFAPRILEYRKQVEIVAAFFKYISLILFLVTLFTIFLSRLVTEPKDVAFYLTISFTSGIIWLFYYPLYFFLIKPLATSKIQVFDDSILLTRGKKETIIPFDEITSIKRKVNKNAGGWFTLVLKNKKKYRFTIVLERLDYILDAVYKYNNQLLSEDEYLSLRKQLILSDHGFGRLYDMFGSRYKWITFTHAFLLPAVFIIGLYIKQGSQFNIYLSVLYFTKIIQVILITLGVLWVAFILIANKILDKHTSSQLESNSLLKNRDTQFESKIFRRLFPVYLALIICSFAGIYKYDLNTYGLTYIKKDSKYLGIKANKNLWVDTKFNCLDCNYSLVRGDIILVHGVGLGKIVNLPNELVTINEKDKKGRHIASTTETMVPPRNLAIQTSGGKVIKLVPNVKIKGKILKKLPIVF